MNLDWHGAWLSVIHHPLFGIAITLGAYQLVLAGYEKTRWVSCSRCWCRCWW